MPKDVQPAKGPAKTLVPSIQRLLMFKGRAVVHLKKAEASTMRFEHVDLPASVASYRRGKHGQSTGSFMVGYMYGSVILTEHLLPMPRNHTWKLEARSIGEAAAMSFAICAPDEILMEDVLLEVVLSWKLADSQGTIYQQGSLPRQITSVNPDLVVEIPATLHPSRQEVYNFHLYLKYQKYHKAEK